MVRAVGTVAAVLGGLAVFLHFATVLEAPKPAPVARPTGFVWDGRVFTSREALDAWLRSKGADPEAWARRHPGADSVFLPSTRTAAPARPAPSRSERAARPAAGADARAIAGLAVIGLLALGGLVLIASVLLPETYPDRLRRFRTELRAETAIFACASLAACGFYVTGLFVT